MTQPYWAASTAASHTTRITSNFLTTECFFSPTGRLNTKIERFLSNSRNQPATSERWSYLFDSAGRLLSVNRYGVRFERYWYDNSGRRSRQERLPSLHTNLTDGRLFYDTRGRLEQAGDVHFAYDATGALTLRANRFGVTRFTYGGDTMPDTVMFPSGETLRYIYAQSTPFVPVVRLCNNALRTELFWHDPFRLAAWLDYEVELAYAFTYDASGRLDRVRLTPMPRGFAENRCAAWGSPLLLSRETNRRQEVKRARLARLFAPRQSSLELLCGCDQVGTPKILIDAEGIPIKKIGYDSFGVIRFDTLPELFLPVGFAGGLRDPQTDLVRFGWRDYDPSVGRFTAPDPLGDTGGDHDLYEYCVDDPVTMNDPTGLMGERPEELPHNQKELLSLLGEWGEFSFKAAKQILPPFKVLTRIGGADPFDNINFAATLADSAEYAFTGNTERRASKGLKKAYEKIGEGLEEGAPKIVDGLLEGLPKIFHGICSLPDGIRKTLDRKRETNR